MKWTRAFFWVAVCSVLSSCATQDTDISAASNADERAQLAGATQLPQPTVASELLSCETRDGMTPYCGYQNPEDLVRIPNSDLLIVSEMGEFMADSPGALSLLNMRTGQRETLSINWTAQLEAWGDADCPAPDASALSPHGIDLVTRADGALALLVVNHGGREAVEFFDVAANGDLNWRGCALPPGDPFINDVAARPDGGFFVTHMWDKSVSFDATVAKLLDGQPTGWVWDWSPGSGFTRIPESDDLMPNGIAFDAASNRLFVNVYIGNKTFAMDPINHVRLGEVEVRQPDNVTLQADGSLLVASHQHDPIGQACTQVTAGPCLLPFQVVRLDANTLQREVIVNHTGPPMGYATVALRVGNRVYLGSAHGDRVVSIQLND